jgi:hypothetical protein
MRLQMAFQTLHHYDCDRCHKPTEVEFIPPTPRPLSSDVVASAISKSPLPPGMDHKPPHGWTTIQRRVLDPGTTADRDADYLVCKACADQFWEFMHEHEPE